VIKDFFAQKLKTLREIRAEPEAVAGGVAIGMFLGFTPFIGFKTVLALLIAWLARCSKLAAVIAVTLHDVLLPVAPFMVWVEYHLGRWVLRLPPIPPPPVNKVHSFLDRLHSWTSLFHWDFFCKYVYPVLVGSILIAIPIAIASYFLTHTVLVKMRQRRAIAAAHAAAEDLTEKAATADKSKSS
jgi:uncharacterized protein